MSIVNERWDGAGGGRGNNSGRRKGEGGWDGWLGRVATRACVRKVWDETRGLV